ncbi:hypothetical protein ABBQ38_013340 [Trebouxia sp. C0009 RCD-2024]
MRAFRKRIISRTSCKGPVAEDQEPPRSSTGFGHDQNALTALNTSWFGLRKAREPVATLQGGRAAILHADDQLADALLSRTQEAHAVARLEVAAAVPSRRGQPSELRQLDEPDSPQLLAALPQQAQQTPAPLPSAQRTVGVQAAGLDPRPSTSSAAVQTDRQGEQQAVAAQQGRLPLSKEHLTACKVITSLVLKATQKARDGYVARAEQDLYTALHKHEEELLVVLGNVPLEGFHLGSFVDVCTLAPSPQAALQNSQRLLQAVPGHFLGRLGQALSCSLLDQDQPAGTPLQPTQLAPGPLGIASAACGFMQVTQAKLMEVKAELESANSECGRAIAGMKADESAWQQLKDAQEQLHRQHGAAMATIRGAEPRHWCASLRAAGSLLVGDFEQAEQLCESWLRGYKGEGYHLWAHMLMWYARMHTTDDVDELRQIGAELYNVVKEARQASLVHLAPHALPNLPKNAVSVIQKVEDTATAVNLLARHYDSVSMYVFFVPRSCWGIELVLRLDTSGAYTEQKYKEQDIKEGLDQCNRMLDGQYAGHSLSVRVTARLYALRATLHCHQGNYLLADADRSYSLVLDPFQHKVLDHWLQQLRLAFAFRGETCVIAMAKDAVRDCHRSGEHADTDEAYRRGLLARAECAQQDMLAQIPGWSLPRLMSAECWKFYCGSGAQNGHKYLLLMSPDKVALRAGDFGNHMGLHLAYIPQVINSAMADHYCIMRENFLHHKDRKPDEIPVLHHLDMGPASEPPPSHAADDGSHAREDSQPAPAATYPHTDCPDPAQHTDNAGQENWQSSVKPMPQACFSQPGSPEPSEQGSADSGRFSPVYRATSPSFSPRGSEELDCMPGPAVGPDEGGSFAAAQQETAAVPLTGTNAATCTDAHPHAGASTDSEQGCSAQETRGVSETDKAADPRPATARGRSAPQSSSRFCFARPAAAQAEAQGQGDGEATSTEDAAPGSTQVSSNSSSPQVPAEGPDQGPAADLSSTTERTPLFDSAHRPLRDAAVPAAEPAQELANHVQAEPVPSASDIFNAGAIPQPTFVWGQAEPPASQTSSSSFFSTTAGTAPFGSAQAGGGSPKQPNSCSRKATGRRPATARGRPAAKQAGSVQNGTEPSAWDLGAASMHGMQFGAVSSQSAVGPDSDRSSMPTFGIDTAANSSRTDFTFAGSSQQPRQQSATATGSTAKFSFTFAAGSASEASNDAEAGAMTSSTDTAAANSYS